MQVLHVVAIAVAGETVIRVDTRRGFNLDDIGAEVGQHAHAGGAGAHA